MKYLLVIILTVVINRLYHKFVDVVYFSFYALCREWGVCLGISMFIVSLIF